MSGGRLDRITIAMTLVLELAQRKISQDVLTSTPERHAECMDAWSTINAMNVALLNSLHTMRSSATTYEANGKRPGRTTVRRSLLYDGDGPS
jgi:hypothetical protein